MSKITPRWKFNWHLLSVSLPNTEGQKPVKPKTDTALLRKFFIFLCWSGPMALQLFSGTVDQSYIPHAIAYAACIGPYTARCSNHHPDTENGVIMISKFKNFNATNKSQILSTQHSACWDLLTKRVFVSWEG